jgi:hypothetical protein
MNAELKDLEENMAPTFEAGYEKLSCESDYIL